MKYLITLTLILFKIFSFSQSDEELNSVFQKGRVYLESKEYLKADSCFQMVEREKEKRGDFDSASVFNSALCLKELSNNNGAIKKFNRCILNNYRSVDAYKEIVYIKQDLTLYEDALDILEVAKMKHVNSFELMMSEIEVLLIIGKYEKALPLIEKGIIINPNYANLYSYKGVLLQKKSQNLNAAVNSFNKCLELDPNNFNALYNLSMIKYNWFLASWKDAHETMVNHEKNQKKRFYQEDGKEILSLLQRAKRIPTDHLNIDKVIADVLSKME